MAFLRFVYFYLRNLKTQNMNPKVEAGLNQQIQKEEYSSRLYLAMAIWSEVNGYPGISDFLYGHAEEERMHMMKLFNYLGETGNLALIVSKETPAAEYDSLGAVFTQILEHEKFVTSKINDLVFAAYEGKDYSTLNFLQWYVAEQHEEESLFSGIIDKLKLIGSDGRGQYLFDRDLGKMSMPTAGEPAK